MIHGLDATRVRHVHGVAVRRLMYGLRGNSNLVSLDLSYNDIGNSGLAAVARITEELNLKKLHLRGNRFKGEGLRRLATMLMRTTTLHTLDLGDNKIGVGGAKYLFEGLAENNSVRTVHLENMGISKARLQEMIDELGKKKIKFYL